MSEKYGVTIVKTSDIEVDLDTMRAWLSINAPAVLDQPVGDQVHCYVSNTEGVQPNWMFDTEILTYPLTDSHVGTTVEIEVCKYCGSPRLTQDATVDCLTGEVRNVYDGVFCRDCENESKSSNTVTVGLDFNPDVDFYKET